AEAGAARGVLMPGPRLTRIGLDEAVAAALDEAVAAALDEAVVAALGLLEGAGGQEPLVSSASSRSPSA
ncbi:hypothetical protein, partial [Streptomyces sp. NPDC002553]|uniref:hypothetical protein n=1 Tax=Streptomyces sp. NPDC002553 TaxID=3154417 RepID=UPI0033204F2F